MKPFNISNESFYFMLTDGVIGKPVPVCKKFNGKKTEYLRYSNYEATQDMEL